VPYNDTDARRHVDIVFDLAAEFGVDVDFHTDFFDEPQHLHARHIAEETVRRGWQDRVALGHTSEMAALPPDEQERLAPARGNRRCCHHPARHRSLPEGTQGRARPAPRAGTRQAAAGGEGHRLSGHQQRAERVHPGGHGRADLDGTTC